MHINDEQDKQEKRKIEEYKKNPMTNFADSINRSQFGDLRGITQGGWLSQIITTVIIIGIFLLISRFINN